jgi:hypothetical protein
VDSRRSERGHRLIARLRRRLIERAQEDIGPPLRGEVRQYLFLGTPEPHFLETGVDLGPWLAAPLDDPAATPLALHRDELRLGPAEQVAEPWPGREGLALEAGGQIKKIAWTAVEFSKVSSTLLRALRPDVDLYPMPFERFVRDEAARYRGTFGLVVSNPPYVTTAEIGALASEQLLIEFAAMLREHTNAADVTGRFSGTALLLLLERGNERDVETWAEQFVARVFFEHHALMPAPRVLVVGQPQTIRQRPAARGGVKRRGLGFEVQRAAPWQMPDQVHRDGGL